MRWITEKLLPELRLIDPGPKRNRLLQQTISGPKTNIVALLFVAGCTGLFVLWDKLVASFPSTWYVQFPMSMLYFLGFGVAVWFTRRDIRRRLRVHLVKEGVSICIPCGYNLTGNVSGICPECGQTNGKPVTRPPSAQKTQTTKYKIRPTHYDSESRLGKKPC